MPWKLVWYCGFIEKGMAKEFEKFLKTGSGKAFTYKSFVNFEALGKGTKWCRISTTKP